MNNPPPPPALPTHWDPVQFVAATVATLAAAVSLANSFRLSRDIGTAAWQPAAAAICATAAIYLTLVACDHWRRGRCSGQPPRAEPWLSILVLVLGWFVLARGPASRLLLTGLAPAIAALSTAAGVSLLAYLRERLVLQRPVPPAAARLSLDAWRCVAAAAVLVGVGFLESRPLPEIKPWETPGAVGPARPEP